MKKFWMVGLLAAALPLRAADWPMFHGNPGLTGRSAEKLPDQLALLWKHKVGEPVRSSAAVVGGHVFVGADNGQLLCLDLATGRLMWVFKTEAPFEASPLVLKGKVYIGGIDGFVYALDARTGRPLWKFETFDKIVGSANWLKSPGKDDWIVVGSFDNSLYCLDAQTGKKIWVYESDSPINGAAAVTQGKTMFGGCDAHVHVIGLAKGKRKKAIDVKAFTAGSVAADAGRVYVGHQEGEFFCIDINKGKILWRYKDRPFPYTSSPALTKDRVIFGGQDKRLHCLDRATGNVKWVFNTRGQVNSSPVVVGNRVLVGSNDGWLYMVSLDKGKKVWDYETGDAITASPAVSGGKVVIGSEDGFVYCFGPKKQ